LLAEPESGLKDVLAKAGVADPKFLAAGKEPAAVQILLFDKAYRRNGVPRLSPKAPVP
jgi:hypothetical protein